MNALKAPFPYFGGKAAVAPLVWQLLGDPGGYVEPFAGSAAVLLARPRFTGRRVETLNDADGWIVNAWRALRDRPDEVAKYADGPVTEIDYHARISWLADRRDQFASWLAGDPEHCDPKAAGWWLYVTSSAIGHPFERGPWIVRDGHRIRTDDANDRHGTQGKRPSLGHRGIQSDHARGHLPVFLSQYRQRLTGVRILCGRWERVLTPTAMEETRGNTIRGIFLDPPYRVVGGPLYAVTDRGGFTDINDDVEAWCLENGEKHRIVLAGLAGEYPLLEAAGWTVHQSRATGSGATNTRHENRDDDWIPSTKKERLWSSPACVAHPQPSLLDGATA